MTIIEKQFWQILASLPLDSISEKYWDHTGKNIKYKKKHSKSVKKNVFEAQCCQAVILESMTVGPCMCNFHQHKIIIIDMNDHIVDCSPFRSQNTKNNSTEADHLFIQKLNLELARLSPPCGESRTQTLDCQISTRDPRAHETKFFVRVLTVDFWKIEKNAVSVMKTVNTFYTKICLFFATVAIKLVEFC